MTTEARKPLFEIRSLTVTRGGYRLLRNVDLSIGAGEVVALVGRNGAGKSTLLKTVVGAYPGSGALLFAGEALRDLSPRERAQRIAYLPQHVDIPVGLTAYEYIALGRHPWRSPLARWAREDDACVNAAVERAGVGPFLARALETLSGGERQRVYLAAALAQQAKLLLLDEPSAALDPVQREDLWSLLARIRAETGVAIIAATHDLDLAGRLVDRIVALRDGTIFFTGAPADFMSEATMTAVYRESVEAVEVSV